MTIVYEQNQDLKFVKEKVLDYLQDKQIDNDLIFSVMDCENVKDIKNIILGNNIFKQLKIDNIF